MVCFFAVVSLLKQHNNRRDCFFLVIVKFMVFICMAVVVLVINLPIAILARVFDDQKLNWSALVCIDITLVFDIALTTRKS